MEALSDKKIIDSWEKNAAPWIATIQENQIESRQLITDQSIIDSVVSVSAETLLDIGCGEGWLARELSSLGMLVSGLDAIPELVQEAQKSGRGRFYVMAYEEMSDSKITEKYDVAVCNFSLLGKESVDHIFNVVSDILNKGGHLIVQTPHPNVSCEQHAYKDGWREGSWAGFSNKFCDPAPWYFRTIESWFRLFHETGYELVQLKEPINPKTGNVAALLMIGKVAGQQVVAMGLGELLLYMLGKKTPFTLADEHNVSE